VFPHKQIAPGNVIQDGASAGCTRKVMSGKMRQSVTVSTVSTVSVTILCAETRFSQSKAMGRRYGSDRRTDVGIGMTAHHYREPW
jgi:hypothetical protein